MTRFKYSYNALVYYKEAPEKSFARVAEAGYDAIELVGEPSRYDVQNINELKARHGIAVSSICSVWTGTERDLVNPDPTVRRKAVDYGCKVADFASAVGAPIMIVGPSPVGKLLPLAPPEDEWKWAVESIQAIASYADERGVEITIEAWNRYETYFTNQLETAVALLRASGVQNGGVHGDMFHMNIEESSIADAYLRVGAHLNHVHLADSNRAAPGCGHTDFRPVLKALDKIGFGGCLTFELLPPAADPFRVMEEGGHEDFLDRYTAQSIATMKEIECELWPNG